ncbi:MAG: GTP-binding protein [Nitrososphaerota archaeon]|jgi:elongation factor 2|nr:GTP-binding protein [Nitrososphaerota archaeon]
MPRFRQVTQIQKLMNNKKAIRNVGIIAHIDHGKTTLADTLLSGTGMLAPSMAGTARVLDYLEEEQKRKITIKTANISLLYKTLKDDNYIINLIDTPGHVDFTGKVTRALRTIDGVIVIVDAVEGIMAQTEIVTRQALKEHVHPVLFINKVDRLITELQLDAKQIQKKLSYIIDRFNDLIEVYSKPPHKTQWKISPKKGNVAFGAALHGWGFTVDIAKQKDIKIQDIITAYQQQDIKRLKTVPIHRAIFEMVINTLPNPYEAQTHRANTLQKTHANSTLENALSKCQDDNPTIMYITNVVAAPDGSCIASGRVFSGKICKGNRVYLVNASTEVEVSKVCLDMGFFQEEVSEMTAGNLGTVFLPLMVKAGETLVDLTHKEEIPPFEDIKYVSEPVMTVAIEPKNPKQLSELLEALEKMAVEDPNLQVTTHKETGEYLLSGMGELHLEIATNQLKRDFGLEVMISLPRVVYMEGITQQGVVACVKGQDNQNSYSIQVEPVQEKQGCLSEKNVTELCFDLRGNVFVNVGVAKVFSESVLKLLVSGFEYACRAGPLCGEPIRQVKVKLVDLQFNFYQVDAFEVMCGVSKAIFASVLTAKPVLFEPIYATTVLVSSEFTGECSRILTTYRGKVKNFEQNGLLTTIEGFIPVAEAFGFSKELRSATSGRAIWQLIFSHWEKLPEKLANQTIPELRKRKGLDENVPKPDKFME